MKEYFVVRRLVNENKFDEAIRKTENMKDEQEKLMLTCMIAEGMIYENKAEDAISLLNNAFKMAREIDDKFAKSLSLRQISFTMAVAGNVEGAVKMAYSIKDDSEKVYALAKISHFLASEDEIEKAMELLDEAEKIIHKMDDDIGKILSIKTVAHALIEIGGKDKAFSLIKYAESIAGKMNEENVSAVFTLIASVMFELGKIDDALGLSRNIKEEYDKAWILSDIAYMRKDANLLNEAVKLARKMEDRYEKVSILSKIACMMADLGRWQEASELINEMLRILERIEYKVERTMAMALISHAMFKNGDERYKESLVKAKEIAEELEVFEMEYAYSLIARVMIEIGEFENALKFIDEIEDNEAKMAVYISIANDLAGEGRENDAVKIAEFMNDRLLKERIRK